MHHALQLETVREQVRLALHDLGATDLAELCETVLVRDGFYCGRSFTTDQWRAVWFAEEGLIKFYGPDGDFVSVCQVALTPPHRNAAA